MKKFFGKIGNGIKKLFRGIKNAIKKLFKLITNKWLLKGTTTAILVALKFVFAFWSVCAVNMHFVDGSFDVWTANNNNSKSI